MKAVVVRRAGGPDVLELCDVPMPQASPGWVLIRVKAFGLNRGELLTRQGHSPSVKFPRILGIECVGIVESAPAGEFPAGTTVVAVVGGMGREFDGSYAEFTCVPASSVYPIKTTLDWVQLAAIPESFVTAWGALYDALAIESGESILIRGGTSSVGLSAASIAKAHGLRVLATTRQPDRVKALLENGADDVLIDDGRLASKVRAALPDGVGNLLDLVGASTMLDSLRCVRRLGTLCMSGILGNAWTLHDFYPGEMIPTGVRLTYYSSSVGVEGPERGTRMQAFVDGVSSGRYRAAVDSIFSLDEISDAHRRMEENRAVGKIIVTVDTA